MSNKMKVLPLYRLDEMSEEMGESIKNVKSVLTEQERLVRVINESKEAESFEQFVKGINETISKNIIQLEQLEKRKQQLDSAIVAANENSLIAEAVSNLCYAVGIFGPGITETDLN